MADMTDGIKRDGGSEEGRLEGERSTCKERRGEKGDSEKG